MFKSILKFVFVSLGVTFIFLILGIYRDIKINKLFNYFSNPVDVNLKENRVFNDQITEIEYTVDFTATDNYLGALYIPVKNLSGIDGAVVFQIRDGVSKKVIHENTYNYNYFNNFNTYIFGFPVIEDSKNKNYQASLSFSNSGDTLDDKIVGSDNIKLIHAKYVFPRKTIIEDPVKFFDIVRNRTVNAVEELDYVRIFSSIFTISLVLIFVSNSFFFRNHLLNLGNRKNIFSPLFDPRYSLFFHVIALITVLLIPILVITNNVTLAGRIPQYIWILLFLSSFWFFFTKYFPAIFIKSLKAFKKLWTEILLIFREVDAGRYVFYVFVFALFLFSGLNKFYVLGGDDTRLFYLYPKEFLTNYSLKIVSDTSMSSIGTSITTATVPLVITMYVLKMFTGSLNLQSMLYTANIFGGVVSFFLLMNVLNSMKNKYSNTINLICSFVYVFSVHNIYTLYSSKLVSIYLVSIFPFILYLFIKSVKTKKPLLLFAVALISSIFSLVFLASPWFLAALMCVAPIVIYSVWNYKFRFVKYLAILLLLMTVLNFHWLFYLKDSSIIGGSRGVVEDGIASMEYKKENSAGIYKVSELNSVFYPLLNTYHRTIVEDFGWANLPILSNWSLKILPFNVIFFFVFVVAGLFLDRKDSVRGLYATIFLCFLISVYFYTVNITSWGPDVFVWLTDHIPFFVIFRNMYDKFAYTLSLSYALLLSVSMQIVVDGVKNKRKIAYLVTTIGVCVVLNIKPMVFGEYDKLPIWTAHNTFDSIKVFNDDFLDLVNYIRRVDDPGKYLVFPLSTGSAFPVEDQYQNNHYYNGVSPLLVLTGKNDFSGLLSFREIGNDVLDSIENRDYGKLGKILQKLNVRYVIVNHAINNELKNSYVFSEGLFFLQDDDMLTQITGDKIKDFGQRYSLYEINRKYDSEKIFLTANGEEMSNNGNLTYRKVNTYLYEITIRDLEESPKLIFLDTYRSGWKLSDGDGNDVQTTHFLALGYANGWKLDFLTKKQANTNLKLYYQPYRYFWIINAVSVGGYLFCVVVMLKAVFNKEI